METQDIVEVIGDANLLIELLKRQRFAGIKSGDWKDVRNPVVVKSNGETIIRIESLQIGFVFGRNGNFGGIYNWKE